MTLPSARAFFGVAAISFVLNACTWSESATSKATVKSGTNSGSSSGTSSGTGSGSSSGATSGSSNVGVQCDTTSDNDYFLSHIFLPKRSQNQTISDAERPGSRSLDRWASLKVIHFGRAASASATVGWSTGLADEINAMDSSYQPAFSTQRYWTFERHTNITLSPYREIFLFPPDFAHMYNFLNSQGGETIAGASDTARCTNGTAPFTLGSETYVGTQACDHVVIANQIWTYNFSAANLAQPYLWNNDNVIFNFGMNSPKRSPDQAVSVFNQQARTRAKIWFDASYSDSSHGNLAAIVNGFGQDVYPTIQAGVTSQLGLNGAFLVEHYTACQFATTDPKDDCLGYELHVYGKSNATNRCAKPMPLGIVAILVGNTPAHPSNPGAFRINNGILAYRNDLTSP